MTNREVTVSKSSKGVTRVTPNMVTVKISKGDQVVWKCETGFEVDFGKRTPFKNNRSNFRGRGSVNSGPLGDHVEPHERYKYWVKMDGAKANDPTVETDP